MRRARHRDAQRLAGAAAQARTVRHASTSLGSERIFSILLPSGYADSDKRYPVVYLFHGGGQDHTAFMARAIFPALARKQEAIFVMPAADRNYSSLSADGQARYNAYVASELVDYVDANYRTIASPQSRAIAGISMGGRIATMTALQHPQRFGVVGAFSAALRMDTNEAVARRRGIADLLLRLVRHARFAAAGQPAVRDAADRAEAGARVSRDSRRGTRLECVGRRAACVFRVCCRSARLGGSRT